METPIEKPRAAEAPLNEEQCWHVLAIAWACARRHGIQGEDGKDLAEDFLVHLLLYLRQRPHADVSQVLSSTWLARAAGNWMKNGLRAQRRRQRHEESLPSHAAEEGEAAAFIEPPSGEALPDREAIRTEFCRRIQRAIIAARLTPDQLALIERLLEGESAAEIARGLGQSPDTVRHRLRKVRLRLRASVRACGLEDAEIAEYLALLSPTEP